MDKRCAGCRFSDEANNGSRQEKRRYWPCDPWVWIALAVAALLLFGGGALYGWALATYGVEKIVGG